MKKLILIILVLGLGINTFSQAWMQNIPIEKREKANVSFYEMQKAFSNYWSDKEIEKGKGWKQFKRWEDFMEPRVYPSGKLNKTALWKEFDRKEKFRAKTVQGNWTNLTMDVVPTLIDNVNKTGIGRINCITFHPTDTCNSIKLIEENGGQVIMPKTSIGEQGHIAQFIDCEGNRVALHSQK